MVTHSRGWWRKDSTCDRRFDVPPSDDGSRWYLLRGGKCALRAEGGSMNGLRKKAAGRLAGGLVLALVAGAAVVGLATTSDQSVLPIPPESSQFGCLNCHTLVQPTQSDHQLNPFGDDYLTAGRQWTPALAQQDSDEDGCTNGFELGDADGDGVLDQDEPGVSENGNPGEPGDCGGNGALTDPQTWGALKALFQR
jgi:hypothetical protein